MKCVIFCRVSSKEQDETGYSLPAQEKLLRSYVEQKGFKIIKTFSISESASGKSQRTIFSKMMTFVQKNKIQIIVCEKVDRLTRNFKDMVMIDKWLDKDDERQVHLVKDSLVLHRNSRSQEKLNWGIRTLFAKNYIDNLSEEVKKGQKEKIAQGWFPAKAPYGYKSVGEKGKKIQVIDDNRAVIIKKMFKYYSSGEYSLKKLTKKMYEEGLRSDSGKMVAKSRIHRLLKDPFYIGKIRWNGEVYEGKQEALVEREIFDRVQKLLTSKTTPKYRTHNFLLKNLIRCSECKGVITWEIQKGHIYGHCNHYRKCSQKTWAKENEVEEQLLEGFKKLQIKDSRIMEWVRKALKDSHKDEIEYHSSAMNELQKQEKQYKKRLDNLYEDKLDEKITQEFYDKKAKKYSKELEKISGSIKKHTKSSDKYFQDGINLYTLSQNAYISYLKAKKKGLLEEQRRLIKNVFVNTKLNEGELTYDYTPAMKLLLQAVIRTNSSKIAKDEVLAGKIFEPEEYFENKAQFAQMQAYRSALLPSSRVLHISINKVISAFDDVVQVELLKTRWGEIKRLQVQPAVVRIS